MALSVAQVDAIVKAAPAGEIILPEYEGLPGDLDYLLTYVLAAVTARYNVDASVFASTQPTCYRRRSSAISCIVPFTTIRTWSLRSSQA